MAQDQDSQGQKTEQPTPERLRRARQDGQIGYSTELVAAAVLLTAATIAYLFHEDIWTVTLGMLKTSIDRAPYMVESPELLVPSFQQSTLDIGVFTISIAAVLAGVAATAGLLQTGFALTTKPLTLKWDKVLPTKGLSKIFNMKNTVRALFSILKASLVVITCYWLIVATVRSHNWAAAASFPVLFFEFMASLLLLFSACSAILLTMGILDFGFQKWKHIEDLKMTMEEVKRENKEQEGDPLIRARIKRLQAESRKQQMLSDVADATVVVRNPTHFAVALVYEDKSMDAPKIVAKGADLLALKIIEIAEENDVPVVEDKPVAQHLYKIGVVGEPIPVNLFMAVAKIIGLVRQLKR